MQRKWRGLIWPLLVCTDIASGQTVAAPAAFAPVREFIQKGILENIAPSLAIVVIQHDKVVWAEGFGYADVERKRPADPNTIYWLASVSKPMTATAIMKLVDQGKIDLDQPANRYLGSAKLRAFVGSADSMTIRRIANHTSGLPPYLNFYFEGSTPESYDDEIRRYGFAATLPGTKYRYANIGFGILGYIVQRVSGQPYEDYMEREVFDPIGMMRTGARIRTGHEDNVAVPYMRNINGGWEPVPPYRSDVVAAGFLRSSANDVGRFLRMHMRDGELDGVRVLTTQSAREMRRNTFRGAVLGRAFGVAWRLDTMMNQHGIAHEGTLAGVLTQIQGFPADTSAIVVLTNGDPYGGDLREGKFFVSEAIIQSAAVLYPTHAKSEKPAKAPKPTKPRPVPTWLVATWTGRMVHPDDGDLALVLTVKRDSTAEVQFSGGPWMRVQDLAFTDTTVNASVRAVIMRQDGDRATGTLSLSLSRAGDRLTGLGLVDNGNPRWAAGTVYTGTRIFLLPHWIELDRRDSTHTSVSRTR